MASTTYLDYIHLAPLIGCLPMTFVVNKKYTGTMGTLATQQRFHAEPLFENMAFPPNTAFRENLQN